MIEAIRQDVRARRARGETVEAVERELIATAPGLDEEQRAALWLLAWLSGEDEDGSRRGRAGQPLGTNRLVANAPGEGGRGTSPLARANSTSERVARGWMTPNGPSPLRNSGR